MAAKVLVNRNGKIHKEYSVPDGANLVINLLSTDYVSSAYPTKYEKIPNMYGKLNKILIIIGTFTLTAICVLHFNNAYYLWLLTLLAFAIF